MFSWFTCHENICSNSFLSFFLVFFLPSLVHMYRLHSLIEDILTDWHDNFNGNEKRNKKRRSVYEERKNDYFLRKNVQLCMCLNWIYVYIWWMKLYTGDTYGLCMRLSSYWCHNFIFKYFRKLYCAIIFSIYCSDDRWQYVKLSLQTFQLNSTHSIQSLVFIRKTLMLIGIFFRL